ncbi:Peptidase M20 domain-containing protein 2 [Escovopsis weberi]|uniref:Peptidase M20 domain-containing protein 2 n=1 Tax=Escovopsis weberi TaxID=150374 RepID=A0A0M8NA20_ESCWE|nr:Peptidase M20 domain-containing protein 2 [Escovopsis weberi]
MATEQLRALVGARLDELSPELRTINRAIHANPELAYNEVFAHETLTDYLEKLGFPVTRHAYGLDTAFEVSVGSGGRQVVVCCEYDALPDIGHGCGHNLIATSSLGAFLAAAHALAALAVPGRLRILGTPAEEGGGGKARLIAAGAFDPRHDVAASLMAHPLSARMANKPGEPDPYHGVAGYGMIASNKFRVEFRGATAHAAGEPWNGVNALDAAVGAYNNVSMLRQQIRPDERVHGVFEVGGTVPNVIPDYTRMNWYVRSPTSDRADKLETRVKACIESAAHATGCSFNYIPTDAYMSIVTNDTLCSIYTQDMRSFGQKVLEKSPEPFTASTDMGNVTHIVPGFHGGFFINTEEGTALHSRGFAEAASTDEAHETAVKCAKGMAMMALRVITDEAVAKAARDDFEKRYE